MKKLFASALCGAVALASSAPTPAAADSLRDFLYENYTQEYWIWAFNEPAETNPLLGNAPFCTSSDNGRVAFLSGTFLDGPQERSCTVRGTQSLYLSVLSGLYIAFESDPEETKTEEAMLDFARCADATATVWVDGVPFDATDSYTETGIFDFPVDEGGLLEELLEGEQTDGAVASGVHVVIPPLWWGRHTIRWEAESMDCGFDTDGDGENDEPLLKDIVYNVRVTY